MRSSEKTSLFLTKLPVSHSKERKEKNCLNCNSEITGRYCGICGQENTEPHESVWDLVTHFFNDITHFDGKFFSSVKYLFTRPGFLPAEYMRGRRASYLNPVRMYIFTSAIFFFIYFSFFSPKNLITFDRKGNAKSLSIDSLKKKSLNSSQDSGKSAKYSENGPIEKSPAILGNKNVYRSKSEYDSLRKAGVAKDGILKRFFIYKVFSLKEKYSNDNTRFTENVQETFKHLLPQTFFLSLPLVAFFLTFLYRRRKQFYYTAHIIFAVYIYVFVYIIRIVTESLKKLGTLTNWAWLDNIDLLFAVIVFYYLYKSMKNFYMQGTWKTLLKFFLVVIWFFIILLMLLLIMLAFTFYKV